MCLETAASDIAKGAASAVTVPSPAATRARMALRVGSERAKNTRFSDSGRCSTTWLNITGPVPGVNPAFDFLRSGPGACHGLLALIALKGSERPPGQDHGEVAVPVDRGRTAFLAVKCRLAAEGAPGDAIRLIRDKAELQGTGPMQKNFRTF